jgi:RimJ/RimL family protein N-acetyltransferase
MFLMTVESIWQGKLVRLRAIEPEDWEALYHSSLDTEQDRLSFSTIFPPSKEYFRKRTATESAAYSTENDKFRWIIENEAGELVGNINTNKCDRRQGTFSYGLGVNQAYRRKGYAREAIFLVLRFFFHELGYQKVNVQVYAFNEGSLALHRSLGFKEEGRLRRMIYTNGKYYDEFHFGMTREEFDERFMGKNTMTPE